MRVVKISGLSAVAVVAVAVAGSGSAMAASDVSNTPTLSNKATGSVAATIASSQASTIISTAATGGFTAGTGGFTAGGSGGFGAGGNGGFGGGGPVSSNFGAPAGSFNPNSPSNVPGGPVGMLMNTRETGQAGGGAPAKLGMWAQGTWANMDKTEVDLSMNGNIYNLVGGLDYKFNDRVLAGLALGGEWTRFTTGFNNGTYNSDGVTVAPYLGVKLTPHWGWDLSVGHTWLSDTVTSNNGANTGSFDAGRWFGATNFTGNYVAGAANRWILSPKVGVLYLKESQDSYTETGAAATGGGAVGQNNILFGNVTGGGKIGYAFNNFVPYAKLMGEWDFKQPAAILKANGQMSTVDDGGGTAALGVDVFKGPVTGTLEGSYNSIGRTDLNVWQTTARLRYQF